MRRPSTEQTEGDLNRLTTSASIRSNESLSSTQTSIKTNVNNDNNNNNSSNYLPNIIIANTEYQQCRKRKDRQDSISSLTQDRKLVRSNSEEHVPSCQGEVIRRVASHEDFKKKSPLKEHNEKHDENVGEDSKSLHPVKEEIGNDQSSSGLTSAIIKLIDVPQPQVHRLSPSNDLYDEHEYQRNSERFLKTKSPSGRKSPRKPRKSSPKYSERDENEQKSTRSNHRHEKREQGSSPKNDKEEEMVTDSPTTRSLLPWEHFDDKPVVCQRFAEKYFDHAHHLSTNFVKHDHHDLVKYISIADDNITASELVDKKPYRSFMNAENIKTRDIMQKSHSPVGVYQTPDERIRQINKRLTSLKKKVSVYEENFEENYGYRPSQADKTNDKHIKNYIAEIHRLRKEKSQIKADPIAAMGYKNKFDDSLPVEKKLAKVKDTLVEIEKVNKLIVLFITHN